MKRQFAVPPPSPPHYHTADSPCLEAVTVVPRELGAMPGPDQTTTTIGIDEVPPKEADGLILIAVGTGWYRCKERAAYYVHDHGHRLVSHYPRDTKFAQCPA